MSRVIPGEELSAAKWNLMAEAAERFHRFEERGRAKPNGAPLFDTGIIKVRNDSGDVRRQGEILEFTGFILADPELPASNQIWMLGGEPALENGFGVLLEALPEPSSTDTGIGNCQVAGVCVALVYINDADDKYATVEGGTYVLQSVAIGPVKIMYKPSGTGEKACVVQLLGVVGEVLVKNESGGDYAATGGPHDYHVYKGTPSGLTDTGQILSAYNIPEFKDGKTGAASLLEGIAYAVPWEP